MEDSDSDLPTVMIEDLAPPGSNNFWIEQWINDFSLKANISNVQHQLVDMNIIEVYTDGSLTQDKIRNQAAGQHMETIITSMGAAAYFLAIDATITATIEKWPFSTRTELLAILLALLATPATCTLKIFTDSECAIKAIQQTRFKSIRKWLKTSNSVLLTKIQILIQEKQIDIQLIKVKAHIGIKENELADNYAKQAANKYTNFVNTNILLDVNPVRHQRLNFFPFI
jgi:ribonuclease HI